MTKRTPKLDKLYEYWNITKLTNFSTIQNNGPKTCESILSKVKRKIEKEGITDYTITQIKDLARCAVLFDSYADIPEFLYQIRTIIPDINGDISRNKTGYKGIHLNCVIDGVGSEIQLGTKNFWTYKIIAEKYYRKWRDFNSNQELKKLFKLKKEYETIKKQLKDSHSDISIEKEFIEKRNQYRIARDALISAFKQQNVELSMERDAFNEFFADKSFQEQENIIESILISFLVTQPKEEVVSSEIKNSSEEKIQMNNDSTVNLEDTRLKCVKANDRASQVQPKLISKVEDALLINKEDLREFSDKDGKLVQLISLTLIEYDKKLYSLVDKSFVEKNIKIIFNHRRDVALEIARYCVSMNYFSLPEKEIIEKFHEDLNAGSLPLLKEEYSISSLINRIEDNTINNYEF